MATHKCFIQRYDPEVTVAPFKFLDLGSFEYTDEELKKAHKEEAQRHYHLFWRKVRELGFTMKHWSMRTDPETNKLCEVVVVR